ncbi:MAG: L-threonylcarbamoyladenylate synthase [Alphaproteobacteria bacterium]
MIFPASPDSITKVAAILRQGGLVALPTETVYGLAADACNEQAVQRIYEAKGRPSYNPLIVHVDSLATAKKFGVFSAAAEELAALFWPGALTLVVDLCPASGLAPSVTAGLNSVGLRCPAHPIFRRVLQEAGCVVAAPSANPSGYVSPTTPQHVAENLGERLDAILAAGRCDLGIESTIIDCTVSPPVILRHGAVSVDEIRAQSGMPIEDAQELLIEGEIATIKAPGMTARHYAPRLPLRLEATGLHHEEAVLGFGPASALLAKRAVAYRNLSEQGDLYEAARNLFLMLRELENSAAKAIAVAPIPHIGIGRGINDRLKRAAIAPYKEGQDE